jgi:uroporphyrin-3 C-methyltransferase
VKTTIFALIIAISVAVLSLFQFDRYQKFTYKTQTDIAHLEKKVDQTLSEIQTTVSKIKNQTQDLLTRSQQSTAKVSEAEYLSSLANTRLQTTRDVGSAIVLLKTALDRVSTLTDPSFMPLQEALQADLSHLKAVPEPNLPSLWLEVSSIIQKTEPLSPRSMANDLKQKDDKTQPKNTNSKDSWQQKLIQSLQEMKDLVKIRHYGKPIEPLLTETQQTIVKEILRSLLEQVRFSILATENALYQQSIRETKEWLTAYFDPTDPTVQAIQQQLTALGDINLTPELPILTSPSQFKTVR